MARRSFDFDKFDQLVGEILDEEGLVRLAPENEDGLGPHPLFPLNGIAVKSGSEHCRPLNISAIKASVWQMAADDLLGIPRPEPISNDALQPDSMVKESSSSVAPSDTIIAIIDAGLAEYTPPVVAA